MSLSSNAPALAADGLEDVQGLADKRGVALQQAGIKAVQMPLTLLGQNGKTQQVAATVAMTVGLPAEQKGTHMSRFVIQLAQWSQSQQVFSVQLGHFLEEMATRLEAPTALVDVAFTYFLEKKAPVTQGSAPMGYNCRFTGILNKHSAQKPLTLTMAVEAPIATLCPCSKAISDFGAHNQRALVRVQLNLNEQNEAGSVVWLEDILAMIDEAASCPVYPLLKREDEKWVTERQYTNPKFVEDVARDLVLALRQKPGVQGFSVEVEALESIHAHNAVAAHQEGFTPPAMPSPSAQ